LLLCSSYLPLGVPNCGEITSTPCRINWGYKKCTPEKLGKITRRSPEDVGP
jgi:hypothetical protein